MIVGPSNVVVAVVVVLLLVRGDAPDAAEEDSLLWLNGSVRAGAIAPTASNLFSTGTDATTASPIHRGTCKSIACPLFSADAYRMRSAVRGLCTLLKSVPYDGIPHPRKHSFNRTKLIFSLTTDDAHTLTSQQTSPLGEKRCWYLDFPNLLRAETECRFTKIVFDFTLSIRLLLLLTHFPRTLACFPFDSKTHTHNSRVRL